MRALYNHADIVGSESFKSMGAVAGLAGVGAAEAPDAALDACFSAFRRFASSSYFYTVSS